ncbi:hypothetical protein ABK040_012048 [Willaertia magna]
MAPNQRVNFNTLSYSGFYRPAKQIGIFASCLLFAFTVNRIQTSFQPKELFTPTQEVKDFYAKHYVKCGENKDTLTCDYAPNLYAHFSKRD